jgi:mRNA-degrading endonuclease toxin of MazEF toxin-antitoxin module
VPSNFDFSLGGRALVAPITQGGNLERIAGWVVPLMGSGTQTQGAVVVSQCSILDLSARGAKLPSARVRTGSTLLSAMVQIALLKSLSRNAKIKLTANAS